MPEIYLKLKSEIFGKLPRPNKLNKNQNIKKTNSFELAQIK